MLYSKIYLDSSEIFREHFTMNLEYRNRWHKMTKHIVNFGTNTVYSAGLLKDAQKVLSNVENSSKP